MSELKPCPHCEDEAALETMQVRKGWEADVHCNGCPACIHTITYDTEAEAIAAAETAWNRRAQPANETLTLKQLREMEWYEPVYVKFKHAIPSKVVSNLYDCLCYIGASESNYGKTWLAYRRPPEMFIGVDLASGHDFTAYGRPPERSENDG